MSARIADRAVGHGSAGMSRGLPIARTVNPQPCQCRHSHRLAASRRWQTELLVENGSSTRCLYHQIVGRLRQHRLRERADGVQRDWDAHAPQRVGVSSGARECRVLSASQEAVDDRPSHVGVCLAAFLSAPRKYPWRALRREAAAPATFGHAVLVDADCQIEVDMPQEPIALSALIEN